MKTPIALVLALVLAALAGATDVTLKDGRVLRNAVITKQDPTTVTVRHAEGFSQVEKAKLPDELAAQYPVDQAAAETQRKAELARAEQIAREQASRATVIRRAPQPITPAAPAPEQVYAADDVSRRTYDHTNNPSSRLSSRRFSFSAPLPPHFNPEYASWNKVHECNGRGSMRPVAITITKPVFRIRCQFVEQGMYAYMAARVIGDDVYAAAWLEASTSGCVYGRQSGELKLEVSSQRGGWSVVVEEADL